MGHTVELVIMWLVWALAIGVVAGALGFVVRALGKREWTTLSVLEGAFAIGVVIGFVLMLAVELLA